MILLFPFPKIQVISGSEKKYLLTDYDEYKIEWLWGFFFDSAMHLGIW